MLCVNLLHSLNGVIYEKKNVWRPSHLRISWYIVKNLLDIKRIMFHNWYLFMFRDSFKHFCLLLLFFNVDVNWGGYVIILDCCKRILYSFVFAFEIIKLFISA